MTNSTMSFRRRSDTIYLLNGRIAEQKANDWDANSERKINVITAVMFIYVYLNVLGLMHSFSMFYKLYFTCQYEL